MTFAELCKSFNSRKETPHMPFEELFTSVWSQGAINDVIVRGLKSVGLTDWLSDKGTIWFLSNGMWYTVTYLIGEDESGNTVITAYAA